MFWAINRNLTAIFDALFAVMDSWPALISLLVLAAITGVGAMIAYKYTSNQAAIGRVRDDMKSSLLSLKLFKDDIGVTFRSQGRLFYGAGRLFVHSLIPLVVMLIPMIPLITQSAMRYEWRPFRPGERIIIDVKLAKGTPRDLATVQLDVPDGLRIDAGPTRVYQSPRNDRAEVNRVAWRLVADAPGDYMLNFQIDGASAEKQLVVRPPGADLARVCPVKPQKTFTDQLLYPAEKPADPDDRIQRIETRLESGYPPGSTPIFGWDIHWFITYLIASMIIALIFKPILKVRM